jgi:hypothetical protein
MVNNAIVVKQTDLEAVKRSHEQLREQIALFDEEKLSFSGDFTKSMDMYYKDSVHPVIDSNMDFLKTVSTVKEFHAKLRGDREVISKGLG